MRLLFVLCLLFSINNLALAQRATLVIKFRSCRGDSSDSRIINSPVSLFKDSKEIAVRSYQKTGYMFSPNTNPKTSFIIKKLKPGFHKLHYKNVFNRNQIIDVELKAGQKKDIVLCYDIQQDSIYNGKSILDDLIVGDTLFLTKPEYNRGVCCKNYGLRIIKSGVGFYWNRIEFPTQNYFKYLSYSEVNDSTINLGDLELLNSEQLKLVHDFLIDITSFRNPEVWQNPDIFQIITRDETIYKIVDVNYHYYPLNILLKILDQ